MTAHKHAAAMMQYAEDAMESETPWERWEVLRGCAWYGMTDHPIWVAVFEYRRKPRTININGHEVPEPVRETLKRGEQYWVADPTSAISFQRWCDCASDRRWLADGLIHLTRKAAQTHVEALLSFTRKDDGTA